MPSISQFAQISDYALIEYIYSDEAITTSQARCLRLENKYTSTYQFLNNAQAYKRTGNILDRSASKVGADSSSWAYHDIDAPVPIIARDSNFAITDVTSDLLSPQRYDTVRLHFLAGFTFPGLDGVILEILFNQWTATGTDQKPFTAAANVYLKSEPNLTYSTDPLFIADRYFDRYLEIKVPSLYAVNFDFWNSPAATNTFGYQYTFGNVGFAQNSQISANLHEIKSITEQNSNRYLNTGTTWRTSFNQQDEYSFIGAVIKENAEYDYIEYYPTYQGGFIEDYINLLNASGEWAVINQLTVYEQVGSNFVKTSDVTILQEENFDQPSVYRPVLRNAPIIYSYSIEYIMRLIDKTSNKEILRRSTFSSTDVKKYGYQLEKINALEDFRPIKVYNKIVKSDDTPSPSISFGTPRIVTQYSYINNYYDVNFISVDSTTELSATDLGQIVYPQGANVIFLSFFDNFVKFKIFTKSKDKKQNVTLDLASNGMDVKLSFVLDDKSQIVIDPTQDLDAANPGAGEILFKINSDLAVKLLGGSTRSYFLVNRSKEGDEVLLYSGKFENFELKRSSELTIRQNELIIADLENRIRDLKKAEEAAISAVSNSAPVPSPSSAIVNDQAAVNSASTEEGIVTVTAQSSAVNSVIVEAASTSGPPKSINIPEVPGVTSPLETVNWAKEVPLVKNPSQTQVVAGGYAVGGYALGGYTVGRPANTSNGNSSGGRSTEAGGIGLVPL